MINPRTRPYLPEELDRILNQQKVVTEKLPIAVPEKLSVTPTVTTPEIPIAPPMENLVTEVVKKPFITFNTCMIILGITLLAGAAIYVVIEREKNRQKQRNQNRPIDEEYL